MAGMLTALLLPNSATTPTPRTIPHVVAIWD
jgi:hypothetical protein